MRLNRKNVAALLLAAMLLFVFAAWPGSGTASASDTIAGSYTITKQNGQRVTVQWSCGNCGKSCGKSTLTWPREGTTSSRSFSCGKCKKRNKVTMYGRNY